MIRKSIICSLLIGMVLASCERMESNENYYVDYGAAMKAGEISRGWIPSYIPKSAEHIQLKYNIDTNQVWLAFRFNSSDFSLLLQSCEDLIQHEIKYPQKSPDWWPKDLRTVSSDKKKVNSSFLLLKCNNSGRMAINDKRNQAYYWYLGNN